MSNTKQRLFGLSRKEEGFTLLEYCAGAAVLIGIVYAGLSVMGTSLSDFFKGVGTWVGTKTTDLNGSN